MVAALTDPSLLHRMSNAYDDERDKIEIPLPWPSLRDDLDAKLKAMTVSIRPIMGLRRSCTRTRLMAQSRGLRKKTAAIWSIARRSLH